MNSFEQKFRQSMTLNQIISDLDSDLHACHVEMEQECRQRDTKHAQLQE